MLLAGVVSDEFNAGSLNTSLWTLVNPVGDGTLSFNASHARLGVPAGVDHSVWKSGNRSARLMQSVDNTDLGLEVKFDSAPSGVYAQHGLIVQQDIDDFLRFDIFSNASGLHIFAASFVNGSPTKRVNKGISSSATQYMRVQRQGNTWTLQHSTNGSSWTTAVTFNHALSVSQVGVFTGNEGSSPPAYTAAVDYFRNTLSSNPDPGPGTNQPPVANNDSASTTPNQAVTVNVLANDYDPDGTLNPGSVTILTQPANGTTQVNSSTGAVTYSPNSNFTGSNSFTYTVRDTLGLVSNTATATIQVVQSQPGTGPTIDVWHGNTQTFGLPGRAQEWVNILGNVQDPDGISSLTYTLNGGSSQPLSRGPDTRRLLSPGDFNVEIDADHLQSTNTVIIRAVDTKGAITLRTVTVNYVAGRAWPTPYTVDWSQVSNIQSAVQVVDGAWHLTSNGVRTSAKGYDRLLAVGDWNWADYEITVPVTVHSVVQPPYSFPANEPGVGFILRWRGHTESSPHQPGMQPRQGWNPLGAVGLYRYNENGPTLPGSGNLALTNGVTYMFKGSVRTEASGYRYQVKVWRAGQAESTAVTVFSSFRPLSEIPRGSALLVAHLTDVTFGDITMTRLGGGSGGGSDTTAPSISNVQALPGSSSAQVQWSTNEATTGAVQYGLTTSYELGSVPSGSSGTSHGVTLTGLAANTTYRYRILATDTAGNSTTSAGFSFQTTSSTSSGQQAQSDEFSGSTLDTSVWTVVNPVGDGTVSVSSGHAQLAIPAGTDHSVWKSGNRSLRLMQAVDNTDLGLEVKFSSTPSGVYAQHGLIIEQDASNFLRFDIFSHSSGLNIFAASFTNGSPTSRINKSIPSSTQYMRVLRQGSTWTLQYSSNGSSWTTAGSFTHNLSVTRVGVFAGNEGSSPPAYTASVDYFRNILAPG